MHIPRRITFNCWLIFFSAPNFSVWRWISVSRASAASSLIFLVVSIVSDNPVSKIAFSVRSVFVFISKSDSFCCLCINSYNLKKRIEICVVKIYENVCVYTKKLLFEKIFPRILQMHECVRTYRYVYLIFGW